MSVEDFVVNTETTIRKYNWLSFLMDIVSVTLVLDSLFIIFNMDMLFPHISTFEVYVGSEYGILGLQAGFESILLFMIAFVLSIPIAIILHIRDRKINVVSLIEKKNALLNERLSTAYDNRNVTNIIIDDLSRNVNEITVKLQPTNFINWRKIYLVVICLFIISSTFTVIHVIDYRTSYTPFDLLNLIEPIIPQEIVDYFGNGETGSELAVMEQTTNNSDNTKENLTGKTAIVVVEGKQVDLTLPPGSGTGFTQGEQANNTPEDFTPSSAYDIGVMSSSIYSEELPEGYESIIKQYFEEMAGK
ncbi:MAG: hypothetical protein A4E23_00601 [Methanomethylovorans sp. PtaU1.Bin073]|nr:MAG: hypothetical protein A4E23_00601 [Methanomethylovorans sp. PtaU1.Bin073]